MTPTPSHPVRRITLVAGAAAVLLGACSGGDDEPLALTFVATGSAGGATDIEYVIDGETTTETVDGEWRLTVEVESGFELSLRVENPADSGDVSCRITEDPDAPPAGIGSSGVDATGEGAAVCELSGTISGNTLSTTGTNYGLTRDEVAAGFEPDFD
jgi:hypothetical protein